MNTKRRKVIILVTSIFLLVNLLVVGTITYIYKINKKQNEFMLGTIQPEILQDYDEVNNIKENVRIKNIGNSPIYVRATILYYFKNSDNQIIKDIPAQDIDYSIIFSSSDNWVKGPDGYYYYKLILNQEESTDNLIDNCTGINSELNKLFTIDIVVQAIQARPFFAVKEAWGVNVVDNKITVE